jgi:hypothetical protein
MFSFELIVSNFATPAILCFVLGGLAAALKSDLRVPPQVFETISIYLLLSIGLKGGVALSKTEFSDILWPTVAVIVIGVTIPFFAYAFARKFGNLNVDDSAALAAHFGSVSAVTFMAALSFAQSNHIEYEGFMPALLAVMEIPGIIIAIALAARFGDSNLKLKESILEAFTGKSIILLSGGLVIGLMVGEKGIEKVSGVFFGGFQGVLAFFLLELGVVAISRLREMKANKRFIILYGIFMPIFCSAFGFAGGILTGLSVGGTAILATMAASASYIAAPAAVKIALPNANPGIYLVTSISITLPFNIAIGIPMFFWLSEIFIAGNM